MPTKGGDFTNSPAWLVEAMKQGKVNYIYENKFTVHTMEGVMSAFTGDYLVRGVKGELYAVNKEIFDATYEPA